MGVPGTPATWRKALDAWGTLSLAEVMRPAIRIADEGFVVNEQFRAQTEMNEDRFRAFTSTTRLFLPNGRLPVVGSLFRNPELARTYRELARTGMDAMYFATSAATWCGPSRIRRWPRAPRARCAPASWNARISPPTG